MKLSEGSGGDGGESLGVRDGGQFWQGCSASMLGALTCNLHGTSLHGVGGKVEGG